MEGEGSDVMAKRILELEVKCDHLKDEKVKLETEVKWVKEKNKEKSAKLKEENEKLTEKYMKLEVQKRKLEMDLKASGNKRVIDNVVQCQQKLLQEKDDQIKSLLEKQKLGQEKNLELSRRVEPTEKMMDLEAEKRLGEVEGMISDLVKRVEASQKAKKALQKKVWEQKKMTEEIKKSVFEEMESDKEKKEMEEDKTEKIALFGKIELLQKDKREMEGKIMEMKAEIDKRKSDAVAFEKEKREMEAKLSKLNRAFKEKGEKKKEMEDKVVEMRIEIDKLDIEKIVLSRKNELLEKDKREMEGKLMDMRAEIDKQKMEMEGELNRALKEKGEEMFKDSNDKDEVIQFLRKENETLEAEKKKLQIENVRLVIKKEIDEPFSYEHGAPCPSNDKGFF